MDEKKFLDNDVKIATDIVAHVAQNHATEANIWIHKHQELIENRLRFFHVSLAGLFCDLMKLTVGETEAICDETCAMKHDSLLTDTFTPR